MAPGNPPPGLGRRRPLPTPPLLPPPHQEGGGQGQGKGRGHQGTLRQEGTEGPPPVSGHSQGQDAGRDTTWGQETTQEPGGGGSGDQGTEEKGTTANATTHTQERHTTTGGPAPPHPHGTPHDSRGRTPQHTLPKQASDAVRITPAHNHQPLETTRGMEGTPTRGERATPTEGDADNAAARRTTTPSAPGDDPGRHNGHLTGTRRGRRHGNSDQNWGPKPPEDTGPRHRPPGRATPRTVTRSTYPTHQPERHAQAPKARTQRDTQT